MWVGRDKSGISRYRATWVGKVSDKPGIRGTCDRASLTMHSTCRSDDLPTHAATHLLGLQARDLRTQALAHFLHECAKCCRKICMQATVRSWWSSI